MRQEEYSKLFPRRLRNLAFAVGVLILISLACNLPTELPINLPGQTQSNVETSVDETIAALLIDQLPEGTAEGTQTPGDPLTSTPTNLSTVSGDVKVYLSENTNCRTGQGTSFERLTILLKGEEAEAVGVDTSGSYWYIRRPDKLTEFCWLWGGFATPTGPYESLPVYTQIPTATPGFEFQITYHSNIGLCGGFYVLQYLISNTGSVTLESWRTTSVDHTGGSVPQPNQQDKFSDISGCLPGGEKPNLIPGDAYYLNAMFINDPTGHDLTVTAQICAMDGLGGPCTSRSLSHTP